MSFFALLFARCWGNLRVAKKKATGILYWLLGVDGEFFINILVGGNGYKMRR